MATLKSDRFLELLSSSYPASQDNSCKMTLYILLLAAEEPQKQVCQTRGTHDCLQTFMYKSF